jgi:ATP-dependent exoDNAse (exonuclease V) beta subunit
MSRRVPNLGIHRHALSLLEEPERIRMARRGELMHQAIRFLDAATGTAIEQAVLRAFAFLGENPDNWKLPADFARPLVKALKLPQVRAWFAGGLTRLQESDILDVDGQVYRPDLIVVREGGIEIVDFKVGKREENHAGQVRTYRELVRAIFKGSEVKTFLLYIDEPAVVEVT